MGAAKCEHGGREYALTALGCQRDSSQFYSPEPDCRVFVRRVSLFSNSWDSVLGELVWAHVTSAVKFSVESVETVGLLGRLKPKRYGYVFFPLDDKD